MSGKQFLISLHLRGIRDGCATQRKRDPTRI